MQIASVIELHAAGLIVFGAIRAVGDLLVGRGLNSARGMVAEGVLAALGFSLAATLLKVISLQQWAQIRNFAAILLLRTLLKRIFQHEKARSLTSSANA